MAVDRLPPARGCPGSGALCCVPPRRPGPSGDDQGTPARGTGRSTALTLSQVRTHVGMLRRQVGQAPRLLTDLPPPLRKVLRLRRPSRRRGTMAGARTQRGRVHSVLHRREEPRGGRLVRVAQECAALSGNTVVLADQGTGDDRHSDRHPQPSRSEAQAPRPLSGCTLRADARAGVGRGNLPSVRQS